MKAAEFEYLCAESVSEVCQALADGGEDSRIIAGGQTLVPLMVMRMVRPTLLIDINHVAELQGIAEDAGGIKIGACTRQADAETSDLVQQKLPLLAKALRLVGHPQTRNRGTVGGSIANADPAAEIPLVALTLDAELVAMSNSGESHYQAAGFFSFVMETALGPDQCLTELRFPVWDGAHVGTGFEEVSIRDSDFAILAAAAQIETDNEGNCRRCAIAIGGGAPKPLRMGACEDAMIGARLDDNHINQAAALAAEAIDPGSDVHASAEYRRRIAPELVARALKQAVSEARP
ncbi:MAG: xanthine dehydrogenase family protein subunit M [Alphaproteobacteria bacterium]